MANLNTKIEWCDATWSPVTGCTKVSTGCKHCYAERLFPRVYGKDQVTFYTGEGEFNRPRMFSDVKLHPERLEKPLHWKKPRMIFVNSMSDLFHEDVPFEFIEKIFDAMFLANQHTYQILTKRLKRALEFFESHTGIADNMTKPFLRHVWFGASIEDQPTADERIVDLLKVPAAVRFLSCEPLLAEIDLGVCVGRRHGKEYHDEYGACTCNTENRIDWVIVGAESGPGYRPMNLDWARSIVNQCNQASVPVFVKQLHINGKLSKDLNAWPEDLRVRQFPETIILPKDFNWPGLFI